LFNIADVPDIKLIKIHDETKTFALAATETFEHVSPPDRLCFITGMYAILPAAGTYTMNSLKVDEVELLRVALAGQANTTLVFNHGNHRFEGLNAVYGLSMMVPFRRNFRLELINAGSGGDVRLVVWAMVHQDKAKKFQTTATLQGQ